MVPGLSIYFLLDLVLLYFGVLAPSDSEGHYVILALLTVLFLPMAFACIYYANLTMRVFKQGTLYLAGDISVGIYLIGLIKSFL